MFPGKALRTVAVFALACLLSAYAAADNAYPARPIKLIVGFAPGGSTDVLARTIANDLSSKLGQQVIVDNRAGAGTLIAADFVSKSAADGYTLMYATPSTLVAALLQRKNLQVPKNLMPVSIVTTQPQGLFVSSSLGVTNLQEFIAYARANPGKINFASSGNGTTEHLIVEALSAKLGIRLTHIPYKGAGPALTDLMAGRVDLMVNTLFGTALEQVKAGNLRLIALTGPERHPYYPHVASIKEAGNSDFSVLSWSGIFAPAGTPPAVMDRLVTALKEIQHEGKLQKLVEPQAMTVKITTPREALSFVNSQNTFFADTISSTNIKIE
jgi:tripartite-type tricarboxylate transporter receptor subunit TctC